MKSSQSAKFRMYHTVNNHLLANEASWTNNAGFSAVVNRFKALFTMIGVLVGEKARKLAGVTLGKQLQKQLLVDMAMMISGTLVAIASEAKNVEMVKKMKFTRSELEDIASDELGLICQLILNMAIEYKEKLVLFNINDETVTDFQNMIREYDTAATAPRNAITERKTIVSQLANLFRDADELLENQLDVTIGIFKTTDKTLVDTYRNNRIIVDKGSRSTQLSGVVVDSVTGKPLKNVLVTVEDTLFVTNTKANGSYSLKVPVTGAINVKFELNEFEPLLKEEVTMKLGKTTEVEAALVKKA